MCLRVSLFGKCKRDDVVRWMSRDITQERFDAESVPARMDPDGKYGAKVFVYKIEEVGN